MIAALYVQTSGSYYGLSDVDPWGEARDARLYTGPHAVICHPPCQRWGKLWAGQPLWIKGDDGGCFATALASVRKWGGVLEHPWGSHAWPHFGLNVPSRHGHWIIADDYGWTCCVEQGRYGHYARKPTFLYAVGCRLPELSWGKSDPSFPPEAIAKHGLDPENGKLTCKELGEVSVSVPLQCHGPMVGFNIDYLKDFTRKHGVINISSAGPGDPAMIKSEDSAFTGVLMPMRIM